MSNSLGSALGSAIGQAASNVGGGSSGFSASSAMPYIGAGLDVISGLAMPKIDYSEVETMDDAQAIAQQAKERASKIGKGLGSAAGAAIGTFLLPGIGTALGGALGGAIGDAAGGGLGGNRQAQKAEAIAKSREAKMNEIVQARKDRAMQYDLARGNTIFQSF
jgi:hypothetical protein